MRVGRQKLCSQHWSKRIEVDFHVAAMKRGNSALAEPPLTPGHFFGTLQAADIELIVTPDAVTATTIETKMQGKGNIVFQGCFIAMNEIVWDHRDRRIAFIMADGRTSDIFFIPQLRLVRPNNSFTIYCWIRADTPSLWTSWRCKCHRCLKAI